MLLLAQAVLLSFTTLAFAASPAVKLGNTKLTGSHNPQLGVDFFGGIPFAEPPLGKLRFKPPVLKSSPGGPSFDAQSFGPACLQPLAPNATGISEDCLSVNVFRPAGIPLDAKLPVIFWTYGGGLTLGSGSLYDGSNLVARSVDRGTPVIYVNHNHRLSLLGFPQGQEAEDKKILNLALKDYLTALEWVQRNIGAFGGDKSKVTVFGQSSGAQIINALMFNSPLPKLARAAIFESGSADSLTSLRATQWESTWQVFVSGVPSCAKLAASGKTLDCLAKASTTELLDAVNFVLQNNLPYGITIDGPNGFLPGLPSQLLSKGQFARMPFIAGTNLDEGTNFADPHSDLSTNGIRSQLIPTFSPITIPMKTFNATLDKLLQLYPDIPSLGSPYNTGNETFGFTTGFKRLAAILGDASLQAPRRRLTQAASRFGVKVYGYLFTQPQLGGDPSQGVAHALEIPYVYGTTDDTSPMSVIMMDYWLSFATSLSPNDGKGTRRPLWPQYIQGDQALMQLNSANLSIVPDTYRKAQIDFINANPDFFHH